MIASAICHKGTVSPTTNAKIIAVPTPSQLIRRFRTKAKLACQPTATIIESATTMRRDIPLSEIATPSGGSRQSRVTNATLSALHIPRRYVGPLMEGLGNGNLIICPPRNLQGLAATMQNSHFRLSTDKKEVLRLLPTNRGNPTLPLRPNHRRLGRA